MKFKVGDKVKIKDDLKNTYGITIEYIKHLRSKFNKLTIARICDTKDGINFYKLEEDENLFKLYFGEDMLETAEEHKNKYTYEDLKKSPIGTKITFENGKFLIKDDEDFYENSGSCRNEDDLKNLKDNDEVYGKIIKIEEPTYETVYEYKPEILDEAEKRYLRGVIRPFRNKVKYIEKVTFSDGDSKIRVKIEKDNNTNYIGLPYFKKDTMYKGMEDNKEYTLEELGL